MRVVGVDIGSVKAPSKFAWAALDAPEARPSAEGADPEAAVRALVAGLAEAGRGVLALEAPMAVPVPAADEQSWVFLGKARSGEGNRPWSAGAGAGALATGLAQGAWMLSRVQALAPDAVATTQDELFLDGGANILLAEAFVSAAGKPVAVKGSQHAADAEAAARAVYDLLAHPEKESSEIECAPRRAFNLLAAMALWAGLSIDPGELSLDVLVVRARKAQ